MGKPALVPVDPFGSAQSKDNFQSYVGIKTWNGEETSVAFRLALRAEYLNRPYLNKTYSVNVIHADIFN